MPAEHELQSRRSYCRQARPASRRGLVLVVALVGSALAAEAIAGAPVMMGRARALYELESDSPRVGYRNAGFRQEIDSGILRVAVDAVESDWTRAPFEPPTSELEGPPEPLATLAADASRGARTRAEAVAGVLHAIAARVRYDTGRDEPVSARAALAEGRGSCVGRSNLAVAALASIAIPARIVRGALIDHESGRSSPHRWLEVFYPDAGWVFSDPTESINYVSALHVVLTPPSAPDSSYRPAVAVLSPPRLVNVQDSILAIDIDPRRASSLAERRVGLAQFQATVLGRVDTSSVVTLQGADGRRQLRVGAGRRFSFPGLSAGSYLLRASFETLGTATTQRLSVLDGELRQVVVRAP